MATTERSEDCCWNDERDVCVGPQCTCGCHKQPTRQTRREWESIKIADFERLEAENERLRAFVQKIIDLDIPEGDEAAALNALKRAAPLALRRP